jgi:hypothetical protein
VRLKAELTSEAGTVMERRATSCSLALFPFGVTRVRVTAYDSGREAAALVLLLVLLVLLFFLARAARERERRDGAALAASGCCCFLGVVFDGGWNRGRRGVLVPYRQGEQAF